MQASTSRRTTAVEALKKQALGALGTISGIAAIAYAVGYLNRWFYFDTFGAGWLIGNLTIAAIPPASFDGLLPLVMLAAVALVQSAERFHSERRLKPLLTVWCVFAVVFLLLDRAGRDTFSPWGSLALSLRHYWPAEQMCSRIVLIRLASVTHGSSSTESPKSFRCC